MCFRVWLTGISLLALLHAENLRVPLGLDAYVPAPDSNALSKEKVELGRALFFWKGLSRDRSLSCGDCHMPEKAFTDGKPRAVGIGGQVGLRRTPPILNRAWGKSFFWDGRASTLEDQVLQPVLNPIEMGLKANEIVERVRADAGLNDRMGTIFGRAAEREDVARALATYVRSILAGDSAYDQFIAGRREALTEVQQAGLRLFRGKANCVSCHVGTNFTDERFHNTGTGWKNGAWIDAGRGGFSHDESERGAFKTPGLREVARTAPYMHDGSLQTLEEVLDFYDRGGRDNPQIDTEIRPLKLTAGEKGALVEFLKSLSGKVSEGWPGLR